MNLNDYVKQIHETALSKGWWIEQRSPLEIHALIHSEVSEATEAVRNGEQHFYLNAKTEKPDGEAVELADCIIRIMDYFGRMGWNLEETMQAKMEYNESRPYRHGGKKF